MASKTNIGAVIGIEGARQYNTDLANIIAKTKTLKAEYKELTTAFDKNKVKWNDIVSSSKKLGEQAEATAQKLKIQTDALQKMQENGKGAKQTWDQYYQALEKQAEAVNKTQAEYNQLMNTIDDLPNKLQYVAGRLNKISDGLRPAGDFLTKAITLPFVGAMTAAVKTAIDYETAFIGVQKTTKEIIDDNDNLIYSYKDLERELVELSRYTASDMSTIFKTAEISGQMGILTDQIPEFTKYMIAMGDATNLSAEEAASYFATVLNLMNKGAPIMAEDAKRLGDAIVYVGNNFNTTEADVAHMMARLAPGAALIGLTTDSLVALATAMSESKITAEGGGTAMTQVFQKINKEFANFSKGAESGLPKIARVAGMSAEDFAKAWENEPIVAINNFIKGLGKLDEEGEYTSIVLDELDMAGIRQNLTLSALSLTSGRLEKALKGTNAEWENGNALLDEAQKFWDSSEGKMVQFRNALTRLGNSFGKEVLPYITDFVESLTDLIDKFAELPSETKGNIIKFVGGLALLGPGIKTFNLLSGAFSGIVDSISEYKKLGGLTGIINDMKGLGNVTGGIGNAGGVGKGLLESLTGITPAIGLILGSMASLIIYFVKNEEEARAYGNEINRQLGLAGKDWDTYGLTVSTVLDETGAYAKDSIPKTVLPVKEASKTIKEDLIDLKAGVRGNLTEMKDIALRSFQEMSTSTSLTTKAMKTNVKTEFDSMTGEMVLSADNAARKVPEKFKTISSGISGQSSSIRSSVKLVMTGVEDEVNSVDLTQSGKHMMQTLINGINSAYTRVRGAGVGVATGIRNVLQFSVPKEGPLRNFDKAMPDMMKLMAKGINDNSYLVEDALANVTGMMAGNIDGNQANYNYGGVVINMNVPEGADGKMLVDEIETELANRTMRRKAVFG